MDLCPCELDFDSLLLEALGSEKLYRLAAGELARAAREASALVAVVEDV